jgi:hypothetical protein
MLITLALYIVSIQNILVHSSLLEEDLIINFRYRNGKGKQILMSIMGRTVLRIIIRFKQWENNRECF